MKSSCLIIKFPKKASRKAYPVKDENLVPRVKTVVSSNYPVVTIATLKCPGPLSLAIQ